MLNNIGQDPDIVTCDEGIYSLINPKQAGGGGGADSAHHPGFS